MPDAWRMNHLARPWHMAQSYLLHPTLDAPRLLAALCRRHRARGSERVARAAAPGTQRNMTHLFSVEKIFWKTKTTAMVPHLPPAAKMRQKGLKQISPGLLLWLHSIPIAQTLILRHPAQLVPHFHQCKTQ